MVSGPLSAPPSLIRRIRVMLLSAATLFYLLALACVYFGGHYLIERNLEKQARQLQPLFGELATPLLSASDAAARRRILDAAAAIADIGAIRIYDSRHQTVLAEYSKPGFAAVSLPDTTTLPRQDQLLIERTAGIATTMQLQAPVRDPLPSDRIAGYVDMAMDFAPSRHSIYPTVLATVTVLTLLLLLCLWLYLNRLRAALQPLINMQEPLRRIAKGDFEARMGEGAVDKEVEIIHQALRTTIQTIKEREKIRTETAQTQRSPEDPQQDKSAFIAALSHDIHTPMNGIIGMLDLLRDSQLTSSQRRFVNMAHASAEDLLQRFHDMQDYAGVDAGKLGLEHTAFDLRRQAETVVQALAAAAQEKGLEIVVRAPPAGTPQMIGNIARIRQVMLGLLAHAIGSSTQGRVVFDVKSVQQHGRCHVTVGVTDSGAMHSGDPTDLFQGESGIKFVAGAPLAGGEHEHGLASCKHLVDMMGGQIGVTLQSDGVWNIWFSLDLPLAPSAAGASDTVRVLCIENDTQQRAALTEQLALCGLVADHADTAAAALRALEQSAAHQAPYHIAILNQHMPGIDGETLGTAIKSDPAHRAMQLVMLSAPLGAEEGQRFAQAGFSGWLTKPVQQQLLADMMAALAAAAAAGNTLPFLSAATLYGALSTSKEAMHPFAGYRVLVADDVHVNQQVAVQLLEKLGCKVDVAANGLQAVQLHAQQAYDLILMDCQMPEMDGYQASTAIRGAETERRTPIIALTAYTMQGERGKCIAAGMDDFLAKPIRLNNLRETMTRWLRPVAAEEPEGEDELADMQEMFGDNFGELAALYLGDTPQRLTALHEANDAAQVARVAHSLSGSCASIGATGLAAMCKELEIQSKAGNLDNFAPRLAAISAEYARIEAKLHAMVQSA